MVTWVLSWLKENYVAPQFRAALEKAKQMLEGEKAELAQEVKALQGTRLDSEQKRKKLEGQVQELQARAGEAERAKAELTERLTKLQVRRTCLPTSAPWVCLL